MPFSTETASSNATGLHITKETAFKITPASPVWTELEPNDYDTFGSEVTTTARNPIRQDRQRKKGVVTDLAADAGCTIDFTQHSPYGLVDGFMFAEWREKGRDAVSVVSSTAFTITDAAKYSANDLVSGESFGIAINNDVFVVASTTGTTIVVSGAAPEAVPPVDATINRVGHRLGAGDLGVVATAAGANITSSGYDLTLLGLIPGEWFFVGGDNVANQFSVVTDNGWYRANVITATQITCDRAPDTVATNTGSGKLMDVFIGHFLKNESDPSLIVCMSYTLERRLTSTAYQYAIGQGANVLELTIPTAEKITAALGYIGADNLGETAKRPGARIPVPQEDAYNTTSNVTRLRMLNNDTNSALYTNVMEASLSIDNGITALKAIGTLGAFDLNFGDFLVTGSVTAYFTTITAVQAVRNNDAVALDFTMITNNQGWLLDVPYLTMSDGRPTVEKDEPITIPLEIEGAAHPDFNHTMSMGYYAYLPTLAQA